MGTTPSKSQEREDLMNADENRVATGIKFSHSNGVNITQATSVRDNHIGDQESEKKEEDMAAREDVENIEMAKPDEVIKLRGVTEKPKARFILLEKNNESADDVWQKMKSVWEVDEPRLIVSVIGSSKPFYLDDEVEASVKATIAKLSKLPGACIITGGAYSGVMKLVGDTLHESSPCVSSLNLGISTSNDVADCLQSTEQGTRSSEQYAVGSWLSRRGTYVMDYQHMNFLIVKDQEKSNNGQISFRPALERHLKQLSTKPPSVLVVINGGFKTLDYVKDYIKQVNEKPDEAETCAQSRIILVNKSGKCADLLFSASQWWENDGTEGEEQYGPKHFQLFQQMCQCMIDWIDSEDVHTQSIIWWETVKSMVTVEDDICGPDSDPDDPTKLLANAFKSLLYCLKSKNLFIIAGLSVDIDTAVLTGLLASHSDAFEKMKLTLLYDRADFAKSEIFSRDPKVEDRKLAELMILALQRGDHEYVKLLIHYNVNMHQVLDAKALEVLYGYQLFEDNFLLRKLVKELLGEKEWEQYEQIKDNPLERRSLSRHWVMKLLNHLTSRFVENKVLIFNATHCAKGVCKSGCCLCEDAKLDDPFWELFIWAVICNMPAMADFLWPFGRDQMAKALIGAEIFEQLSRVEAKYKQATQSLKQSSMKYRTITQDMLDELSATCEEKSRKMITRTLRHVPNMTCIDIAVKTKHYEFVAHNSIQMILWDVWTGYLKTIRVRPVDYIKFMLSIVFPFYLVSFESEDRSKVKRLFTCSARKNAMVKSFAGADHRLSCGGHRFDSDTKDYSFWTKLNQFYFSTPIVTFLLHFFGATIFLVLYSYYVVSGHPARPGNKETDLLEAYLVLYMIGYVVGEFYQIMQYDGKPTIKLWYWVMDTKNQFDTFNCSMYFFALALSSYDATRSLAHTLHSINCGLWIIRFSIVVRVFSKLGLYFEMITTMLVDLLWFLVILGVFITAFGVTSTSLLYPASEDPLQYLHMFLRSWFSIYGEYFMEIDPDKNTTTHLSSPKRNPYDEYVVIVIMGLYLLLTNLLLLNIIIAAFNTTYANIQEQSFHISRYRIYDLVLEYSRRVSTPPPLSLLHHLYKLVVWCVRRYYGVDPPPQPFMEKLRREERKFCSFEDKLRDFEYCCAVKVLKGETKGAVVTDDSDDSQTQLVVKQIDALEEKLFCVIGKAEGGKRVLQDLSGSSSNDLDEAIWSGDGTANVLQSQDTIVRNIMNRVDTLEEKITQICNLVNDTHTTQQQMLDSIKTMEVIVKQMDKNT